MDEDHRCLDMECGVYHYERWGSLLERSSAFLWEITQRMVVIPYRRFGSTYRPPSSEVQEVFFCSFWFLEPLKTGPMGCPETSVQNYHHTLRNIPGEHRYRSPRGGSLKSRIVVRRFLRSEFKYLNRLWLFIIHLVASVGDCVAMVFGRNKSMYGITRMFHNPNVNIDMFHVFLWTFY